jgi:methylated-DNA-[protein]-cysteine S-methyltransferase
MTATDDRIAPYALIETGIGWIGIAWSERGLARLQLPGRDREATERRLLSTIRGRAVESIDMPAPIADLVGML